MPLLEYFRIDMTMHEAIAKASGNAALIATHRQYNARLWRARFLSSQRAGGRPQTNREHRAIAEALHRRDANAAGAALGLHLATIIENTRHAMMERARADGA